MRKVSSLPPIYTCENCTKQFTMKYLYDIKALEERSTFKNNRQWLYSSVVCSDCGYCGNWPDHDRKVNRMLRAQERMERRGWCTGLQRKYK